MDNKSLTCCFTGHRTLVNRHCEIITDPLLTLIRALSQGGFNRFITGGALGFDTLAAQCVLKAAETDPSIRLILAIPCFNQTEKWNSLPNAVDHLRIYKKIMGQAHEVIYTSQRTYFDGCMKIRNQYMVDHSSVCIAYWNGTKGGTSQTVRMAQQSGLEILNLYDELERDIR